MPENVEKLLHDESNWILENVGVKCTDSRIVDLFESTQLAAYDPSTQRLYILRDLIKACLEVTPKRELFPVPMHSFGGGGVAAFVKQGDDYITPVTEIHVAEMMRIAEEFEVPFMFKGASPKYNWQEEENQVEIMRKWYSGYLYVRTETSTGLQKCKEEYDNTGMLCTTHSILNSPLKFNETGENVDIFFNCAQEGLPLYITSMPITCLTGPASLYGIALQAYSEFLVGLCLAQIINPGITVVNGAYPAAGDPRKGYAPAIGSIFHNMANYLVARTAGNIPSIQSGCTISSEKHEPIEGSTDFETERSYKLWSSFYNWHQVRHSFGFINSLIAFDIDKMRRDLVALRRIIENEETMDVSFDDVWYDSEAHLVISEGVDKDDFRFLYHTTKMMGILDEYLK